MILPHVEIIRLEDNFPQGTFGALLVATEVFCWTLEPPTYDNKKNFACIPAGQYECKKRISPKFSRTVYEICNVPDRSDVEFHPGNIVLDTMGCVLLGDTLGKLKGNRAVLNSGYTFTSFMNALVYYDEFKLTIKEAWS